MATKKAVATEKSVEEIMENGLSLIEKSLTKKAKLAGQSKELYATETEDDRPIVDKFIMIGNMQTEELQDEDTQDEESNIEDVEFIEMQRARKSEIVSEIKRRAGNLDRFQKGRSSKFNGDKYIYRKLLQMVDASQLEELNEMLKAKLEKLI